MAWKRTLPGVLGRLQVPGLDALQLLLETLGEAKRRWRSLLLKMIASATVVSA